MPEEISKPLISVLMTAYNREKYIAEAIESVLSSTYTHFELIIVDDGSKDKTLRIAQGYAAKDSRIKVYINEQNLGDYPNRNKAASYASGKYMTYVDSDDKILAHCLLKMVEATVAYPDAAVFMLTRDIDEPISQCQYYLPIDSYRTHFEDNGFLETGPLGTLILTKAFKEIGGFSGKRMIGDTELFLKLAAVYPLVKIEKNLVFWRSHDNQETNSGEKYYLVDIVKVYRDVLYSPSNPIKERRRRYLLKSAKPRILQSFKLFIKHRDFNRLKYVIEIISIVTQK